MSSETEVQARLQQMVTQEIYGADALLLLQALVVFRTPFSREGLRMAMPSSLSRFRGNAAFVVLCRWQWVLPTATRHTYQIDPALSSLFMPTREIQSAHFSYVILHGAYAQHPWHQAHWQDVCAALAWGLEHRRDDAHRFLRVLARLSEDTHTSRLRPFLNEIIPSQSNLSLRADLLCTAAVLAQHDADHEAMYDAYEQAISLYEQVGNTKVQSLILFRLANYAAKHGDVDVARDAYTREISLNPRSGSLSALIAILIEQADWRRAYDYLEQWTPTSRDRPARDNLMVSRLADLGLVVGRLGRLQEARIHFAQGYQLCDPAAHKQQWLILWRWGEIEIDYGDTASGLHLWQLALLAIDTWLDEAEALKNLPVGIIMEQRRTLATLQEKRRIEGHSQDNV